MVVGGVRNTPEMTEGMEERIYRRVRFDWHIQKGLPINIVRTTLSE